MNTLRITVALAAAAALLAVTWLQAGTVTWTGGGSGTNWNEPANWDTGVPGPEDTAQFTSTGLTANRVIALGASQTISNLVIATTLVFTIGNASDISAGYTLVLQRVDRLDVSGTEGNHTIAVPVILPAFQPWTVSGDGALVFSKAISGIGGIEKLGGGELQFSGGQLNTYSGSTRLTAGTIGLNNSRFGSTNVIVGGGATLATVRMRYRVSWQWVMFKDPTLLTIRNNGLFDLSGSDAQQGQPSLGTVVEQGGVLDLGSLPSNANRMYNTLTLKGGIVNGAPDRGGWVPNSRDIIVDASALTTSEINCQFQTRYYYSGGNKQTQFIVNDGAAPIDLKMTGRITNMTDGKDGLDKAGAGVMRVAGASIYGGNTSSGTGGTGVKAGTLLVDNAIGSGTGKGPTTVSAGATLGGVGFIGGVDATYAPANVSLTGASGNLATLAPGSIDETTGAHQFGTLTVGSGSQTNNVACGNLSRMQINFGTTGQHDQLAVYGLLNLASTGDRLELSVPAGAKAGNYTLASAANGVVGQFDTVTGKPAGAQVVYTATTVELQIPASGTVMLVR